MRNRKAGRATKDSRKARSRVSGGGLQKASFPASIRAAASRAPPLGKVWMFLKEAQMTWVWIFTPALLIFYVLCTLHLAPEHLGRLVVYDDKSRADESILYEDRREGIFEVVAEGFQWTEGPLWMLRPGHEGDKSFGRLLFSDVKTNTILKWEPTGISRFANEAGCRSRDPLHPCDQLVEPGSNGLAFDAVNGGLVVCEHGARQISQLEKNGSRTLLATHYNGLKFNSPNDLVFSSRGDLLFTDPEFGLQGLPESSALIGFSGVYHISPTEIKERLQGSEDGKREARLLWSKLPVPNGIAFSPDESNLYVANSDPPQLWSFQVKQSPTLEECTKGSKSSKTATTPSLSDILAETADALEEADPHSPAEKNCGDGSIALEKPKLLADMENIAEDCRGTHGLQNYNGPDGIKVDTAGRIYLAGMCGVHIFDASGKRLASMVIGTRVGNLAWGGDGMLYVAASSRILRLPLKSGVAPIPETFLE